MFIDRLFLVENYRKIEYKIHVLEVYCCFTSQINAHGTYLLVGLCLILLITVNT
jgi:hypothetical protein